MFPRLIIEAALSMEELHLVPHVGLEVGFAIALNHDDSPNMIHPFLQDLQMQWSRQRNAWQRPESFVGLWLVGE